MATRLFERFRPIVIEAIKLVAETDSLLGAKADGTVVNLKFAFSGRNYEAARDGLFASIHKHLLDHDLRQVSWPRLIGQDSNWSAVAGKPEFATRSKTASRLDPAVHLRGFDAIRKAVERDSGRKSG